MIAMAQDGAVINQAARDQYIQMLQVSDSRHLVPAPGSPAAQIVDDLLIGFQPSTLYPGLLARLKTKRWVSVTGSAGSGKSTLLASMTRPELTLGQVPDRFVHAIVFCDAATQESLAAELSGQLARSVPGYLVSLSEEFTARGDAFQHLPALERLVSRPLARLFSQPAPIASESAASQESGLDQVIDLRDPAVPPMPDQVRIIVDGLDQLRESDSAELIPALTALATTDDLDRLRIIAGHRTTDLDGLPPQHGTLPVETRPAAAISRYLGTRGLETRAAAHLADLSTRGASAWLAARLIADIYAALGTTDKHRLDRLLADTSNRDAAIAWLYNRRLDTLPGWPITSVPASDSKMITWAGGYLPVMTALVVTGSGPVAPISILTAVSAHLGGPDTEDHVRAVLDQLKRLVIRTDPGTDRELAGLFHPTLIDHLSKQPFDSSGKRLDLTAGTRILLDEIDRLTPKTALYIDNPMYRWAAEAQAEHAWHFGMPRRALKILRERPLPTPRQNLDRWTAWWPRILSSSFGPQDIDTLTTRSDMAYWTGHAGDATAALRLSQELLLDQQTMLGPRHPDTLTNRNNIAYWTGHAGDATAALRLSQELLLDQQTVLGPRHPDTLRTRGHIVYWIETAGDATGALRLYQELLLDQQTMLGPRHPDTLRTRSNIASWTGRAGDAAGALRLYQELLPDQQTMLGPRHPDTLTTRNNIASWTGHAGDAAGALRLFKALLPDQQTMLGPRHPDTLRIRAHIASWIGETGDANGALRLFKELLPDRDAVQGSRHPDTLTTRGHIAYWTGMTGDAASALRLFQQLLPDQQAVLGPRHPDTLRTRSNIASWTGRAGDAAGALRLYQELLPDQQTMLGPRHPDTLTTRNNIASWTGEAAKPSETSS